MEIKNLRKHLKHRKWSFWQTLSWITCEEQRCQWEAKYLEKPDNPEQKWEPPGLNGRCESTHLLKIKPILMTRLSRKIQTGRVRRTFNSITEGGWQHSYLWLMPHTAGETDDYLWKNDGREPCWIAQSFGSLCSEDNTYTRKTDKNLKENTSKWGILMKIWRTLSTWFPRRRICSPAVTSVAIETRHRTKTVTREDPKVCCQGLSEELRSTKSRRTCQKEVWRLSEVNDKIWVVVNNVSRKLKETSVTSKFPKYVTVGKCASAEGSQSSAHVKQRKRTKSNKMGEGTIMLYEKKTYICGGSEFTFI